MNTFHAILALHLSLLLPDSSAFNSPGKPVPLKVDGFSHFQKYPRILVGLCKPLLRMSNSGKNAEQDYYKILGVSPQADQKAIRNAFIKGAKRFHPDVTQDQSSLEK
eukprot:750817-Hanusia_phi.AAC.1